MTDPSFTVCHHEWRLIDEKPATYDYHQQEGAPGYGTVIGKGTKRRWYCVHCRDIETITED